MMRRLFNFPAALVAIALVMGVGVAFDLSYRGLHRNPHRPEWPIADANARRGRQAIIHYGCGACHVIPGIALATGRVGPRLEDFVNQSFIAGVRPNTAPNLIEWIQNPQDISPQSAMPNLGVTPEDARDIAEYLYSVR